MTALLFTALLLILIIVRVPVSFAVLVTGILGLLYLGTGQQAIGVLETAAPSSVMSYTLSAAPLFIFMAQLILMSGLVDALFIAARTVVGRLRGGTALLPSPRVPRSQPYPVPVRRRPPRSPLPRPGLLKETVTVV